MDLGDPVRFAGSFVFLVGVAFDVVVVCLADRIERILIVNDPLTKPATLLANAVVHSHFVHLKLDKALVIVTKRMARMQSGIVVIVCLLACLLACLLV